MTLNQSGFYLKVQKSAYFIFDRGEVDGEAGVVVFSPRDKMEWGALAFSSVAGSIAFCLVFWYGISSRVGMSIYLVLRVGKGC